MQDVSHQLFEGVTMVLDSTSRADEAPVPASLDLANWRNAIRCLSGAKYARLPNYGLHQAQSTLT